MFQLTLVTPEKRLLAGAEIEEIFVPAYRGELNILPGHAPLMTTLSTGILKYRLKGETALHRIAISWGYCQVSGTGVNVLAETAERADEIDLARSLNALKLAEEKLSSVDLDVEAMEKLINKVARARVRQDVAQKGEETSH